MLLRNLSLCFSSRETPFGRALLYGYDLPPSFPFQILPIVFYKRDTLGSEDFQDPQTHNSSINTQKSTTGCLSKTPAPNCERKELSCLKGMEGSLSDLATCPNQRKPKRNPTNQDTASRAQAAREQDTLVLTNCLSKTPAPILYGMEPGLDKGMKGLSKDLTTWSNQGRTKKDQKKPNTPSEGHSDTEQNNDNQSVNQQTWEDTWRSVEGGSYTDKGKNFISAHGPSCQGPRTLLVIHLEL